MRLTTPSRTTESDDAIQLAKLLLIEMADAARLGALIWWARRASPIRSDHQLSISSNCRRSAGRLADCRGGGCCCCWLIDCSKVGFLFFSPVACLPLRGANSHRRALSGLASRSRRLRGKQQQVAISHTSSWPLDVSNALVWWSKYARQFICAPRRPLVGWLACLALPGKGKGELGVWPKLQKNSKPTIWLLSHFLSFSLLAFSVACRAYLAD